MNNQVNTSYQDIINQISKGEEEKARSVFASLNNQNNNFWDWFKSEYNQEGEAKISFENLETYVRSILLN